jgi:hypothetical protein
MCGFSYTEIKYLIKKSSKQRVGKSQEFFEIYLK